jgi:hypothetical protein
MVGTAVGDTMGPVADVAEGSLIVFAAGALCAGETVLGADWVYLVEAGVRSRVGEGDLSWAGEGIGVRVLVESVPTEQNVEVSEVRR